MLTPRGNSVTVCAQYVRYGTAVGSFVADLRVLFTCFFLGDHEIAFNNMMNILSLSLFRATKCAVNSCTFCRLGATMYAGDDKMCR